MSKTKTETKRITAYADTAKIVVVKPYEGREGSAKTKVWELVRKSKTIAAYRAARKSAKLGDNLGGMLAGFVNGGYVRVNGK